MFIRLLPKFLFAGFLMLGFSLQAEDLVVNLKTTQGADVVSLDSIFITNISNGTELKLGDLSQSNALYKINLTQGVIQNPTAISEPHLLDGFALRPVKSGLEVITNRAFSGNTTLTLTSADGRTIYTGVLRSQEKNSSFYLPLPQRGIYFVKAENSGYSQTFKVISSGQFSTVTSKSISRNRVMGALFGANDSIRCWVKRGSLISPFWFGRPANNDDISMILPTSNNLFSQTEIVSQNTTINPTGFAPLTASIQFSTSIPTKAEIKVFGKNGPLSDVVKRFDTLSTSHNLPILGLYGGYSNTLQLTLLDELNHPIGSSAINLQTNALSGELPNVTINTSTAAKKPGMTLVSYRANLLNYEETKPFIFDEFGDIRWYLTYTGSPVIINLFYDAGMERLRNGNFYFGNATTNTIYEINMLGEILNSWPLVGYGFHHQVLEKPNGNFLVNVDKKGLGTIEDHMIEIDRTTKQIINVWDLRQSLQYNRRVLTNLNDDWIHTNAVEYDEADSTIFVSGRTQGVVKLDANNRVKWLMAPHKGWGIAGNGVDLNTKLLQPLDANNQLITDTAVINGYTNHPDFEWNWCQHAIKKQPNGHFTLFDNGDLRNFIRYGPYSRAVEYQIDPVNMTIKQIWEYGKERGSETYSRIVSDVDFLNDVNHVIFSPGAVFGKTGSYGKIVEVDYQTKNVLFEATVIPPKGYNGVLTFHRTERLNLYPY